ncbi:hypothetical protein ES708_19084 [subsurface metagenome]
MIIIRTNIIKTKLKIIDENIELVKGNLPEIHYSQKEILKKTKKIYLNMLNSSENVSEGNFTKISVEDLKFLFEQYNKDFFSGFVRGFT